MAKEHSYNPEMSKPGQSGYTGVTSESKRGDSASEHRGFRSDSDLSERGSEFYDQTKKTLSDTYNKTADAFNKTYDQAMAFGRDNPGKVMLMALGGGLVIGLLLANRNRRTGFNIEPVMNTLSQAFSDIFRRRWA